MIEESLHQTENIFSFFSFFGLNKWKYGIHRSLLSTLFYLIRWAVLTSCRPIDFRFVSFSFFCWSTQFFYFPFSAAVEKIKNPVVSIKERKKKNTSSATIMSIGNKRRTRKETNRSVHRSHNSDRWRKMFACLNFQIFPDRQAGRYKLQMYTNRYDTRPMAIPITGSRSVDYRLMVVGIYRLCYVTVCDSMSLNMIESSVILWIVFLFYLFFNRNAVYNLSMPAMTENKVRHSIPFSFSFQPIIS